MEDIASPFLARWTGNSFVHLIYVESNLVAQRMLLPPLNEDGGPFMPYLRLYARDVTIEQKNLIAQKLIEITLSTFHLRPEERNRITIQFLQPLQVGAIPRGADFALEVIAHHLTEAKRREFAAEAAATLAELLPTKARSRIARLLGLKSGPARQIAFQFDELSPAISDPVMEDPELWAA